MQHWCLSGILMTASGGTEKEVGKGDVNRDLVAKDSGSGLAYLLEAILSTANSL